MYRTWSTICLVQLLHILFLIEGLDLLSSRCFNLFTMTGDIRVMSNIKKGASLVAQMAKNLPEMQETWVQSLGWEDPLEKEMTSHSSILAWKIPWRELPGRLWFIALQRIRHDWAANTETTNIKEAIIASQCILYSLLFSELQFTTQWSNSHIIQWSFLALVSQSLSCVWLFATPWTAARQAFFSITNSWSLLKLMSIESVMLSNHLTLCHPLLFLSLIFPSIRVFSNKLTLRIRQPKYWSICFSIILFTEYSGLISFRID